MALLGLLLGAWTSGIVAGLLLIYIAVNLAYSVFLKHVVILDVFVIASGFVMRVVADARTQAVRSCTCCSRCGCIGVVAPRPTWRCVGASSTCCGPV